MANGDDPERLLDALRTIAGFFSAPPRPRAHDLILHTDTPDPAAVRRAIRAGKLPASKIGRCYWLTRADLEAYVAANRVAPRLKKAPAEPKKRQPADVARSLFPDRVVTTKKPA